MSQKKNHKDQVSEKGEGEVLRCIVDSIKTQYILIWHFETIDWDAKPMARLMANTFNTNNWEAEAERLLWVPAQPGLHNQLQDSLGSTERACLKTTTKIIKPISIKKDSRWKEIERSEIEYYRIEWVWVRGGSGEVEYWRPLHHT